MTEQFEMLMLNKRDGLDSTPISLSIDKILGLDAEGMKGLRVGARRQVFFRKSCSLRGPLYLHLNRRLCEKQQVVHFDSLSIYRSI